MTNALDHNDRDERTAEVNTVRRNKPLSSGALMSVHDVVHGCYRGSYTSYNRDVRLATAVRDKYWP